MLANNIHFYTLFKIINLKVCWENLLYFNYIFVYVTDIFFKSNHSTTCSFD